ncbi:hypothetical protein WA158_006014 [Blastocystis sp. Blastoise]
MNADNTQIASQMSFKPSLRNTNSNELGEKSIELAATETFSQVYNKEENIQIKKGGLAVLFTTFGQPKNSESDQILRNTIISLSYLRPSIQCVLFTDVENYISFSKEQGCIVISHFITNENHIPYINDLFIYIQEHYKAKFYGYINSDILLDDTIVTTLNSISSEISRNKLQKKVFISGKRTNIDFTTPRPVPIKELYHYFIQYLYRQGNTAPGLVIDYFIFSSLCTFPPKEFPRFIVGRIGYDNYIGDYIYHHKNEYDWIDISTTVVALHQSDNRGDEAGKHAKEDLYYNIYISERKFDHGDLHYANYFTKDQGGRIVVVPRGDDINKERVEYIYEDEMEEEEKKIIKDYIHNSNMCIIFGNAYISAFISSFCKRTYIILYEYQSCLDMKELFSTRSDIEIHCKPNTYSLSSTNKNIKSTKIDSQSYILSPRELDVTFDAVFIYGPFKNEVMNTISFIYIYKLVYNSIFLILYTLFNNYLLKKALFFYIQVLKKNYIKKQN